MTDGKGGGPRKTGRKGGPRRATKGGAAGGGRGGRGAAKTKGAAKGPARRKAGSTKASPGRTASGKRSAEKGTPSRKGSAGARYTDPALRERLKKKIIAGEKGGRSGQWSARKAQLLAAEYEKKGGGYAKGGKTGTQKSLTKWGGEKWRTSDGKKAVRGRSTARYLPDKAWSELSASEKRATEKKKSASRSQFVPNTPEAKAARKSASGGRPRKK